MHKTPLLHALAASVYIVFVVSLMHFGGAFIDEEKSFLIPIAMLSLFVFSASVMGFLFCATPIMLYLDGKKQEAFTFFLKTVGYFGAITLALFVLLAFLSV